MFVVFGIIIIIIFIVIIITIMYILIYTQSTVSQCCFVLQESISGDINQNSRPNCALSGACTTKRKVSALNLIVLFIQRSIWILPRWRTGTKDMGHSSQYPIWMGRCFAMAHKLSQKQIGLNDTAAVVAFSEKVIANLPAPGTLLSEAQNSIYFISTDFECKCCYLQDELPPGLLPHRADPGTKLLLEQILPKDTFDVKQILKEKRERHSNIPKDESKKKQSLCLRKKKKAGQS